MCLSCTQNYSKNHNHKTLHTIAIRTDTITSSIKTLIHLTLAIYFYGKNSTFVMCFKCVAKESCASKSTHLSH